MSRCHATGSVMSRYGFGGVRFYILTFLVIAMGLQLQFGEQFLDSEFVVSCHGFQDSAEQSAGFQRTMVWNRHMMRSVQRGGHTDVGAVLSHRLVA